MQQNRVPQDAITTYSGNKKAMYATDEQGNYTLIASSGWEVEEVATMQAVHELQRLAQVAHTQVLGGKKSPLFFHMYARRMDLQILAESVGIFKWRIKRHFNPKIFKNLSRTILDRYADALGISRETLLMLPEEFQDPQDG